MISYYWTQKKGKMYLCHLCKDTFPAIIVLKIDNVEVQFCDNCWKPEYRSLSKDKNVNENVDLSN